MDDSCDGAINLEEFSKLVPWIPWIPGIPWMPVLLLLKVKRIVGGSCFHYLPSPGATESTQYTWAFCQTTSVGNMLGPVFGCLQRILDWTYNMKSQWHANGWHTPEVTSPKLKFWMSQLELPGTKRRWLPTGQLEMNSRYTADIPREPSNWDWENTRMKASFIQCQRLKMYKEWLSFWRCPLFWDASIYSTSHFAGLSCCIPYIRSSDID